MKIIKQRHEIMNISHSAPLLMIEQAGRTCYKSEKKITRESAKKFIKDRLKDGHESILEHVNISVKFITNRSTTHCMVRHRISAYSQESTHYINYKNQNMEFIKPVWISDAMMAELKWDHSFNYEGYPVFSLAKTAAELFIQSCVMDEYNYKKLLELGWPPKYAREVLSNAFKTEIVTTKNLRQWRHEFKERTAMTAHPQIRELFTNLVRDLQKIIPVIFDEFPIFLPKKLKPEITKEELAKTTYETYGKIIPNKLAIPWETLPDKMKEAWIDASAIIKIVFKEEK